MVDGRYRVRRLIGQGGMGAVVAAERVQVGGPVAIKFLDPKLARDAASVERFFREAKATMLIKSEHVVRVLDVGQSGTGIPYIVMELLEGQDLGRLLSGYGALPVTSAVDYVLQASEALAEAHAAGIVHRDLKPSNLWLSQRSDGSPHVKVLDFGISKLTSHVPGDPKLTETQSVFGSPTYMSPEQIRSAKKVDHRTDVWALGVVLHELLSNKLPFDDDTVSGVLAAISADPPVPLRQIRPDAPPGLEAAILSCLQKDVNRRCQSLADFALALAPFASPVGAISADRISRIGGPKVSMMPPPPSSVSGDFSAASGITERSFATASTMLVKPRSPLFGVALGAGIAVVLIAAAALVVALRRHDPGTVAGSAASASVTLASSTAIPGHAPIAATGSASPVVGLPANPVAPGTPSVVPLATAATAATPGPAPSGAHLAGKPKPGALPGAPVASVASAVSTPGTPAPATAPVPVPKPGSTISDTSQ